MPETYSGPRSHLSEQYAELYQRCQDEFYRVLRATRDPEKSGAEFTMQCRHLTKCLSALRQYGEKLEGHDNTLPNAS